MSGLRINGLCALCLVLPCLTMGCGASDRAGVSGEVTLGGQPVQNGSISFVRTDGSRRANEAAWGKIENGRYSIPATAGPMIGKNRVEIRWPRKTGRKNPADPNLDEYAEAIPDRYNANSELQVEVRPGNNTFNFALQP